MIHLIPGDQFERVKARGCSEKNFNGGQDSDNYNPKRCVDRTGCDVGCISRGLSGRKWDEKDVESPGICNLGP